MSTSRAASTATVLDFVKRLLFLFAFVIYRPALKVESFRKISFCTIYIFFFSLWIPSLVFRIQTSSFGQVINGFQGIVSRAGGCMCRINSSSNMFVAEICGESEILTSIYLFMSLFDVKSLHLSDSVVRMIWSWHISLKLSPGVFSIV